MKKHTPGPWTILKATRNDVCLPQAQRSARFVGVIDSACFPVAEVHFGDVDSNLCLIAAAPDLLQAANAIWEKIKDLPKDEKDYLYAEWVALSAAIDKAEGKS
mgnify:CR=1 FL=1